MEPLAFYCTADTGHFLGLVALVNSLRLLGHDEQIYVLDCGFDEWQRQLLERETLVVAAAPETTAMMSKTVLPRAHPAEVMVVVDVDVIFTRRIDELVDQAGRTAKPVLFLNDRTDRFYPDWWKLGYGEPVPHPYLASGQFVLPAGTGLPFLDIYAEALLRRLEDPALEGNGRPEDPFFYPDMDVLNALVGPALPLDSFVLADESTVAYWPFTNVRVLDETTLAVEGPGGVRPILLHHILAKPWITAVASTAYSHLMVRLLSRDDVAIHVPPNLVPRHLRQGLSAALARVLVDGRARLRQSFRGRLRLRAWVESLKQPS
jgi:hypothetical protein